MVFYFKRVPAHRHAIYCIIYISIKFSLCRLLETKQPKAGFLTNAQEYCRGFFKDEPCANLKKGVRGVGFVLRVVGG